MNERLLKVEDLEQEVFSENPEVEKREIDFEGGKITVYDLKGLPFCLLSTAIDYRDANKPGEIGTETYRKVLENPAIWAERRDEAEKASGFGTRNGDARGDTISTSYRNSERNATTYVGGKLVYGLQNVRADSIIGVFNGDGGTNNMAGRLETSLISTNDLKWLESSASGSVYNEILLRRYSENGMPKKPDYIITDDGKISEESLRHAKYFNIPIVNIEQVVYTQKENEKAEKVMSSISEKDSYEELEKKIDEILRMKRSEASRFIVHLIQIGRSENKEESHFIDEGPLTKRGIEISRMEQLKRLDFLKDKLEEATSRIKLATEQGVMAETRPPGFKIFTISMEDVHNKIMREGTGERRYIDKNLSYSKYQCNSIDINFILKDSFREILTCVHDGERVYELEKALKNRVLKKEDLEKADSSFYDKLEPVVLKYFDALYENRKMIDNKNREKNKNKENWEE